jgi:hypothetical protein
MTNEPSGYADLITLECKVVPSPMDEEFDTDDLKEFNNTLISIRFSVPTHDTTRVSEVVYKYMYGEVQNTYTIEETHRNAEYGASGVLYDIALTVGSEVLASLVTHLITNFKALKYRSELIMEHAAYSAISTVQANTGIPQRFIQITNMTKKEGMYQFLLTDTTWL